MKVIILPLFITLLFFPVIGLFGQEYGIAPADQLGTLD